MDLAAEPPGLTDDDASARLTASGPNELPQEAPRGVARIAREALREPMLQLLVASALLYLLFGELTEALFLCGFAVADVALVVIEEARSERALQALRALAAPHAVVIRSGRRQSVAARDLVVGDLLVLAEGGRVPADARVATAEDVAVDESLLTGESVPVTKRADGPATAEPGGEGTARLWSGTLLVRGHALAEVVATGRATAIGRIGLALGTVESAPTPLQTQTRRLTRQFAVFGLVASVLIAVMYGLRHGAWLEGLLAAVTLAMAALPEEFPVVLTVFLALGARRLSGRRVLTRRVAAIEALGAATVLCTDKTGTLTENRMRLAEAVAPDRAELTRLAALASAPASADPMERALHEAAPTAAAGLALARTWPLRAERLVMAQLWRGPAETMVAAKGAPEAVATLCRLDPPMQAALREQVAALAGRGLRVLAVARAPVAAPVPETLEGLRFDLVGLVGLADPLRAGVPAAVAMCRQAGIAVAMITGDHPATAKAIAAQAGIDHDLVLTGPELARLDDAALALRVRHTRVFARITPDQKLRLVRAFIADGEIVTMTGDGVNDAPALKAAHIGVAMGRRGTDVAREAASLVLLDDDFESLVEGMRMGRRIADNLRKAITYVTAVHVPAIGLALLPVLFGWPMVLGPLHVVMLEMIIDPMSAIGFEAEPEARGAMTRPPRRPDTPLFDLRLLVLGVAQGTVVLVAALAAFLATLQAGAGSARAVAFIALVLGNLGLVLTSRGRDAGRPSGLMLAMLATAAAALAAILAIPWLRGVFTFTLPNLAGVATGLAAAFGSLAVNAGVVAVCSTPASARR